MADFSRAMQLPIDPDAELLVIDAGELQALVRPHPQDPTWAAIVIEVQSLGEDAAVAALPSATLLALHRLNHAAWTEHGWQILIDDHNVLGLRASRALDTLTAQALEDWIVEGLERGQTLQALWREASESAPASATKLEVPDWRSHLSSMIRG